MIISGKELGNLKQIKVRYADPERKSKHAILINGFVVMNVKRFAVKKDLIYVLDTNDVELARIKISGVKFLETDEELGEYKFHLK